MPHAVSEANWLAGGRPGSDTLLISSQGDGFTALLFRGDEPAVVRTVTCGDSERDDEIFRLLMFYNDRLAERANSSLLEHLLVVGRDINLARVAQIALERIGRALSVLRPEDVGLDLAGRQYRIRRDRSPSRPGRSRLPIDGSPSF